MVADQALQARYARHLSLDEADAAYRRLIDEYMMYGGSVGCQTDDPKPYWPGCWAL